jgi:hypothetical protein
MYGEIIANCSEKYTELGNALCVWNVTAEFLNVRTTGTYNVVATRFQKLRLISG